LNADVVQSLAKVIIHVVFGTKSRAPLIKPIYRKELFSYMSTIAEDNKCEVYEIGGVSDHIHILCGLPRTLTLAKLVETLKRTSSKWLKTKSSDLEFFAWQNGYAVFSVKYDPEYLWD
jgi:REP element-mobilizing transposase RayT